MAPEASRGLVLCLHHGWSSRNSGARGLGQHVLAELFAPGLRDLNSVLAAPDCPGSGWSDAASERSIVALRRVLSDRYGISPERIVLAGISDGATAAWRMMARYPDLFSAVVPIAGSPQLDGLEPKRARPVYAIHSRADEVMPLGPTRAAIGMLQTHDVPATLVVIQDAGHLEIERFVSPLRAATAWLRDLWSVRDPQAAALARGRSSELVHRS
jgi:pimeloyl-ACP methyl ester carboxylesterase